MLLVIRSDAAPRVYKATVSSYDEASKSVRNFIEAHDLGSRDFHIATLTDGKAPLATITYNGRVWACKDGSEIKAA